MNQNIQTKASQIQERLWDIATQRYGLVRSKETIASLRSTFGKVIKEDMRKHGLDDSLEDEDSAPPLHNHIALAAAFVAASIAEGEGDLDMLLVATEALGMLHMTAIPDISQDAMTSRMASLMAHKRHEENKKLKEEAIDYWKKNIDSSLSAQKAATTLIGVVPLSHKKLAEIIAIEKRKTKP